VESIFLWPDAPAASLGVLWLVSAVFLWAAREPMLKLISSLGGALATSLEAGAKRLGKNAVELRVRSREVLLAAGTRDAQGRLDRELERMDAGFADQLGQYADLQRRLDERVLGIEQDYQNCGIAPPEIPGWSAAVEAVSGIPIAVDPNVQKVLEGIKTSSEEAERKALTAYRNDSAKRHKILATMLPYWKEVRSLLAKMNESVTHALERSASIHAFVEDYQKVREESDEASRALAFSAVKFFFVSVLVLGIALGGAFINFQLIALPMSELVPAGARVGSVPVSTVSALVLVLMEGALGIFVMDMLGITELFPKLSTIPRSKRRMILWLAFAGLFFLASVESSLAILREQIVEADAALKLALSGEGTRIVQSASQSKIPVIGQAMLGFILPWALALVAVPLEMLLDSGRHIAASLAVIALRVSSALMFGASGLARHATVVATHIYDVYISIPLRFEALVHGRGGEGKRAARREFAGKPDTAEESLA
jgi:hypothetical protein